MKIDSIHDARLPVLGRASLKTMLAMHALALT